MCIYYLLRFIIGLPVISGTVTSEQCSVSSLQNLILQYDMQGVLLLCHCNNRGILLVCSEACIAIR